MTVYQRISHIENPISISSAIMKEKFEIRKEIKKKWLRHTLGIKDEKLQEIGLLAIHLGQRKRRHLKKGFKED